MKYFSVLLLISVFSINLLTAQVAPDKYWIEFTDKSGTPYSLDEPQAFFNRKSHSATGQSGY